MNDLEEYLEFYMNGDSLEEDKLEEYYRYYTENISVEGMPISLETSKLIYCLCKIFKFKTLMDRGSGFSSFVLRLYAEEQDYPVNIFSIDDNPEWLEKTREYLLYNKLSIDNLYLWKDFYNEYEGKIKFDFILEDGSYELRTTTPDEITSFLDLDEGFILYDDAHYKNSHNLIIESQCKKLDLKIHNTREITKDKFGRFSLLCSRNIELL